MDSMLSIEDGYQIVMLYLTDLWIKVIKNQMIKNGSINSKISQTKDDKGFFRRDTLKDQVHFDSDFFFIIVSDGTSDNYFEEVIEKRMGIPPTEQHKGLNVSEDQVFQLCIDFCEFFNERFLKEGRDSLRFAIDWLKDMRENPDDHKKEWEMWNQVVVDVTEKGAKSLGFF